MSDGSRMFPFFRFFPFLENSFSLNDKKKWVAFFCPFISQEPKLTHTHNIENI
jgi:hypothetical protein